MMTILAVGTGAGLVSALLFAVVVTGSPLAVLLSYVAPLPIFIAALGWNHRSGLVAAAVGALATMFAFRYAAGLTFVVGVALPSWWLAYLTLLGRANAQGGVEWYPIGRLLLWMAGAAALVTLAGAVALGGSYESYVATMRQAIETVLRIQTDTPEGTPLVLPGGMAADDVVKMIVAVVPSATAASLVPMLALNLWLAAKAVALSGRLPRPWPSLPATTMPRDALFGLVVAIIVMVMADGFVGVLAQALFGALMAAFALQGLAAIHALTLGRNGRGFILGLVYALVIIFLVWMLPLLALGGIVDALFRPRERRGPHIPRSRDLTS